MSTNKKPRHKPKQPRDNHQQTSNNNGNNSDSKDSCVNYFILNSSEALIY